MWQWSAVLIFILCNLAACEKLIVANTPQKKPIRSKTKIAVDAQRYFWKTLHDGSYQNIDRANYLLMAAYLQNPNDPDIAAHLGFLHIWKLTERDRYKVLSPLITNEIILSKKYFSDAVQLEPYNPVFEGFLGDSELIEGKIFHDKREEVSAYFALKHAINDWPEFNYFTAGYPMSTLPADSDHFKEAVNWQWLTLDLCAGKKIDRSNPDFGSYMQLQTNTGRKRACWNSWVAPYNFEGFFMNMGDMLVKSGDWQTGIKLYQNAKLASNYRTWPFREMLEKRIKNAENNVNNFQKEHINPDKSILLNSSFGCVVCHKRA